MLWDLKVDEILFWTGKYTNLKLPKAIEVIFILGTNVFFLNVIKHLFSEFLYFEYVFL
jgi:hypothetical protein